MTGFCDPANDDASTLSDCQILGLIFARRLGSGMENDLAGLSFLSADKRTQLIHSFTSLQQQLSTLIGTHGERDGRLSLDLVLKRLIHHINQALNADRSSLFLYDQESDELYSHIAMGGLTREIRFPASRGIAGSVFRSAKTVVIADAYADPRFHQEIDEQTGYRTHNILCAPFKDWNGNIIGVTQVLNKLDGEFDAEDQALLEALTSQAASALESTRLCEDIERTRHEEEQMLSITAALSSELHLDALLIKIMEITTDVLDADRSTLLLYEESTDTLCSKIAQGLGGGAAIRIPKDAGIAGTVFTSGEIVNITDAYNDPRFNPEVDRATGYATRTILCVPVVTRAMKTIGIIQVLNKSGGPFTEHDARRLKALAAQAAVAIENARLFEAVLNAKNYSESILRSLSNGVITLDRKRRIIKANPAALRILGMDEQAVLGTRCERQFAGHNQWIPKTLEKVVQQGSREVVLDTDLQLSSGETVPLNLHIEPLLDAKHKLIGFLLFMDDITKEKRIKSTIARYMSRELAERLLESDEALLGGKSQEVTILFSDIQDFTKLTEYSGARATVAMLNEYFSEMAEIVFKNKGILDKYIGDALMALFGTPFPGPHDADSAVTTAVEMLHTLEQFNRRRLLEGHNRIDIRLGISTGEVIVGNIGSPRRMDYTVVGHNVNIASRMESANAYYGTRIIITEATRSKLQRDYLLRELDLVRVKGSQTPVSIYEVLDGRDPSEYDGARRLSATFSTGLGHYRERNWHEAAVWFDKCLKIWPGDPPANLYLNRCRHYHKNPPPEQWDGVWTMTRK